MSTATRAPAGAPPPLRYTLPALDGPVWLGLRPGALVALALTTCATVTALMAGLPIPLAVLLLGIGTGIATVPVAGRSLLAWTPVLLTHLHHRVAGRAGWSRPLIEPSDPATRTSSRPQTLSPQTLALPPEYGRLQLRTLHSDEGGGHNATLAALRHRDDDTVTVVLEVTGPDRFALLDPAAQDSQLARWGTCLAALAADPDVLRIQWLTHTRPDTRDPAADQRAATTDPRLQADYADLATAARQAAQTHEHLLALTLTSPGSPTRHGPRRSRSGTGTHDALLVEHVRDLAATLLTADLLPHPLSPAELGTALRRLTDPLLPQDSQPPDDPRRWAVSSRHSSWEGCRTDDSWHRSFAVAGWPRLALPADWLAPVLHTPPPAGTSRTLAVHALPVAPQHAARQARAARAKAHLDAADRHRLGFTSHTSDTLAETDAAALEVELVAGYRLTQLTALVTVSAPDPQRLQVASAAMRTLSISHRLDLRPLHGQHHRGLIASLPLGVAPSGARP